MSKQSQRDLLRARYPKQFERAEKVAAEAKKVATEAKKKSTVNRVDDDPPMTMPDSE